MVDHVDRAVRAVRAVARWSSYALLLVLVIVSQLRGLIDNWVSIRRTLRMERPIRRWERGPRDEASTSTQAGCWRWTVGGGGRFHFQKPASVPIKGKPTEVRPWAPKPDPASRADQRDTILIGRRTGAASEPE